MASTDTAYSPADYRVRLFLSVDLSGSTAFKNSELGREIDHGASPKWVKVFQKFYTDFPDLFKNSYSRNKNANAGEDHCPSIWKAVGDELIFCGRVTNKAAVEAALNSFIITLLEYRQLLAVQSLGLNVKGAAWLGAFPEPNRAVEVKPRNRGAYFTSATEALEDAADHDPFDFDFLGKEIDTGFRVAGKAQPERFALSAQLARLLSSMPKVIATRHEIRVDYPIELKGVTKGIPYPNLYIETWDHLTTKPILENEQLILKSVAKASPTEIDRYLTVYCEVAGTDEIKLPDKAGDPPIAPPNSYIEHRNKLEIHLSEERGRGAEAFFEDLSNTREPTDGAADLPDEPVMAPLDK